MQDEGKNQSEEATNWQFKPGDTIAPGQAPAAPAPAPEPAQPSEPESSLESVPQQPIEPYTHDITPVSWTASEFVSHSKSAGWYILLTLAAVVAATVIFFVTDSYVSAVTILFAGGLLGVFAFMTRKPRTLHYEVDNTGVRIENKMYPYGELKAFTIQPEGPINAIVLLPTKRFMPPITMYYDQKDEDRISDTLSGHLPFDEEHNDPVDNFMRKIRF